MISIPAMNYLSTKIGIYGILSALIIVYFTQAFVCRMQIRKLLANKAVGLWNA